MKRTTYLPLTIMVVISCLLWGGCRGERPQAEEAPAAVAPPEAPQEPEPEPLLESHAEAVEEVREHRLTVADVQRYARATENVQRALSEHPEDPGFWELERRLAQAASIEEVQQILDQGARVQQALRQAGITSRDYVLTGTALLEAYQYVMLREMGIPNPERPEYVADEHIRFIEHNRAEVDAIVARLQALYGVELE